MTMAERSRVSEDKCIIMMGPGPSNVILPQLELRPSVPPGPRGFGQIGNPHPTR